jgi:hypothetical protein
MHRRTKELCKHFLVVPRIFTGLIVVLGVSLAVSYIAQHREESYTDANTVLAEKWIGSIRYGAASMDV